MPILDEQPAFITISFLYRKTSRSGRPFLFGSVGGLRLYAFEQEERQPKDAQPAYRLCLRSADFQRLKDKLPAALAVAAPERIQDA